jgi:uncharacterized protein
METPKVDPSQNKVQFSLDLRVVIAVLALVILGMFAMWRPWEVKDADRTIVVTGQSTLKAAPDEFVFTPAYDFKNANKQTALNDLTKKSDELVSKVKALGVQDADIKTNSDGYDYPVYRDNDKSTPVYTLRLTVTVDNKDLAQKVQDYLVTTTPTGSVSPQAAFSDAKRKELESKARDEATKDARSKAEQSAKNLGFGLGAVKNVNDGSGFGGIVPFGRGYDTAASSAELQKLTVQPGENDLSYSVTVTYFVR